MVRAASMKRLPSRLLDVKNLTKEQEELVSGTIWKMLPKNVCVECHKVQGHGDSQTPPELKKKPAKK